MTRIAVLGSSGMLGSALTEVLSAGFGEVIEFNRSGSPVRQKNDCYKIDAEFNVDFEQLFSEMRIDYIVNAIGMIKQVIREDIESDLLKARIVNCDFVAKLNSYSEFSGVPVIQIGTDCVFSGERGNYLETDLFEATDIYSQSKIDGEKNSPFTMIIRTSIIGKEIGRNNSLLNWVLSQEKNAELNGYTNHFWNGLTTLHFSNLVKGIIKSNNFRAGTFHVLPSDQVSKYELLRIISEKFNRMDLNIVKFETLNPINRSLGTVNSSFNQQLWAQAGYDIIPSIEEMVSEYSNWLKPSYL
jgi:dTDP-4-dehydrorhamnose reductase